MPNKIMLCYVMLYHAVLTLMVFKLLLCLSSPNFPSGLPGFSDVNQLKVKFVDHYAISKNGLRQCTSLAKQL